MTNPWIFPPPERPKLATRTTLFFTPNRPNPQPRLLLADPHGRRHHQPHGGLHRLLLDELVGGAAALSFLPLCFLSFSLPSTALCCWMRCPAGARLFLPCTSCLRAQNPRAGQPAHPPPMPPPAPRQGLLVCLPLHLHPGGARLRVRRELRGRKGGNPRRQQKKSTRRQTARAAARPPPRPTPPDAPQPLRARPPQRRTPPFLPLPPESVFLTAACTPRVLPIPPVPPACCRRRRHCRRA